MHILTFTLDTLLIVNLVETYSTLNVDQIDIKCM
jgi:hypothetical protein